MLILALFAFVAGIVTILSPCILPILPIVLSSSVGGGKRRPLGIVTGFILSFTFFTLFLSTLVRVLGISPNYLRYFAIVVIFVFGASLLIPKVQVWLETLFSKLSGKLPQNTGKTGYGGGLLIGVSIGLLWTPCVGPILAAVISLALTGAVSGTAFLITLSYAVGTAIPMFAILYGGRNLLNKVPWLLANTTNIQRGFGVLMIITAVAIYFNFDRSFQTFILQKFPSYGIGLTSIEQNNLVKNNLKDLNVQPTQPAKSGESMFNMTDNAALAPELIAGGQWFNLPNGKQSLTLSELRGKVVVVDFWTYTCINCIRTLPYLKSWYAKYADKGLVIIGVHTPEFEFEKDAANVKKAIADFGIEYPVMQDNNYATWKAYNNIYWPAEYFINKDGKIVHTHFGEGNYDESEKEIQKLLKEAGSNVSNMPVDNPTYQINSQTPETYLGYARQGHLVSPERVTPDATTNFSAPQSLPANSFAFTGDWMVGSEYVMPSTGSTLLFNFNAQKVYLVMRPIKSAGTVKVYLDGQLISDAQKGDDVVNGVVKVDSDRLYNLVKLQTPGTHVLKLEFQDANIEAFAFTFG